MSMFSESTDQPKCFGEQTLVGYQSILKRSINYTTMHLNRRWITVICSFVGYFYMDFGV